MSKSSSEIFGSAHYQRHNARRLEHLARLSLPLEHSDVLELGSGPGDHTTFFLDRGCTVTAIDARQENLDLLNKRLNLKGNGRVSTVLGDLERPGEIDVSPHSLVYCYGLLYHLRDPESVLNWIASRCEKMLLLETCVSFGGDDKLVSVAEKKELASQSFSGTGSRPTRAWIYNRLNKLFSHVYVPAFQPYHEEFPTDWTHKEGWGSHARAIFVASREAISNPFLLDFLPPRQMRG
ncbi:class I SAM-dependent methyltransferase [Neoaquamicrobium sediminum]|uniref:class I SAM-dependent methyltransferase n=1 Tax=Neoaquamicrobium sediminum TaxID=1849104 RepID=UPI00156703AE|nr:class I SAM-dependent methyltransferase [Mesorhizobium sediminum]NRC56207.1 methyltransferase domain-containing protein [Mesorhizobium sediminum]